MTSRQVEVSKPSPAFPFSTLPRQKTLPPKMLTTVNPPTCGKLSEWSAGRHFVNECNKGTYKTHKTQQRERCLLHIFYYYKTLHCNIHTYINT